MHHQCSVNNIYDKPCSLVSMNTPIFASQVFPFKVWIVLSFLISVSIDTKQTNKQPPPPRSRGSHHHHHQFLNREGRWGTADDFATSFLHCPLFSTALWDIPNSRPVHSLMLSSHLFLCLPCLLPPFTVPCKMVLARPDEREAWPYHCSLRLFTIVSRGSQWKANVDNYKAT